VPTYQYACTECDERLEVVQSFSDAALTECPRCSGRLRKVFSAVGVVFKGSGFYKTDSRSGGSDKGTATSGEGAGADKPAASAGKGSADKGSSDKGTSTPAAAASSSSTSTPAAKSA